VFYGGHLDRFTDWLAGALPALDVLSRSVPRGTQLLLPAHIDRGHHHHDRTEARFNHRETLVQLGYNRLPSVQSEAGIVLAEEVVFMDNPSAAEMPAAQLTEFRDHALLPYDGMGEPTRRLYIRTESRGIEERGEVERFLLQQGFEHVALDHLSFDQQIRLFRQAAFVVSPHHAGLSHLVFSTPGVKVLEVMDEGGFAPDFWRLSGKLGHVYGFMGCPTVATPMGPRLAPDADRFRYLFKVLEGFTA
jgi:capsular polysaccharide biosynthesis protein